MVRELKILETNLKSEEIRSSPRTFTDFNASVIKTAMFDFDFVYFT